ncbi:MAG: hypothetical protein FJ031_08940 [Chloroflexi bacterium]|nr:hypothetical protein [Chloroflexota bacterium]
MLPFLQWSHKYIYSASDELQVKVWDIESKKQKKSIDLSYLIEKPSVGNTSLEEVMLYIKNLKISPNGRFLALVCSIPSEHSVFILWDIENKKSLLNLECASEACISFSNDSKLLVIAGANKEIQIYNLDKPTINLSWKSNHYIPHQKDLFLKLSYSCVCFSENGQYLVYGSVEGDVFVWNSSNGKLIRTDVIKKELSDFERTYRNNQFSIRAVYFLSKNEVYLQSTNGDNYKLNITTGEYGVLDLGIAYSLGEIVSSLKATYFAYLKNDKVRILNLRKKVDTNHLIEHINGINCIQFSTDETLLATGGEDGLIKVLKI